MTHEKQPLNRVEQIGLNGIDQLSLFGHNDANLRWLRQRFGVSIVARGDALRVEGASPDVLVVRDVLEGLIARVREGAQVAEEDVRYATDYLRSRGRQDQEGEREGEGDGDLHTWKGPVSPRTPGQRLFVDGIRSADLVFCIGPAGTGKTYLAMACAVDALRGREVDRIVLVRPAVEAGESLGFLPGDPSEKVAPYLRPLYDALHEMIPADKIKRSIESGVIEVAPLAYMRGRTLNRSFVVLDEAQNTTLAQMKMFLTRLGVNSKAVVTGDVTQIDLADRSASGLLQVPGILRDVAGIRFCYLDDSDVVRHRLVQEIIRAFEHFDNQDGKGPGA